jgi:Homing endonuclease associated repeat
MAASVAQALARIDRDRLDRVCGLEGRLPLRRPPEAEVAAAFEGLEPDFFRLISLRLARRARRPLPDAEDAIQDVLLDLHLKHSDLLRQEPERWAGRLFEIARFRLASASVGPSVRALDAVPEDSLDRFASSREEPVGLSGAGRSAIDLPFDGGRMSSEQMIGALHRFRDHHGRRPKLRECRTANRLPSAAEIRREFGSFRRLLVQAGMAEEFFGHHVGHWTPREAALACRSFRIRHGYWPCSTDIRRFPGELPSSSTMVRLFGSTRAAFVQRGAEAILGTL